MIDVAAASLALAALGLWMYAIVVCPLFEHLPARWIRATGRALHQWIPAVAFAWYAAIGWPPSLTPAPAVVTFCYLTVWVLHARASLTRPEATCTPGIPPPAAPS